MQTAQTSLETTSNDPTDDLTLIHRIAASDHQAFEMLYQRYTPWLNSYLNRFCHAYELVEDVVHDTFLVVWDRAEHYRGTGKVSTWIFGIARNKAFKAQARSAGCPLDSSTAPDPIDDDTPERCLTQHELLRLSRQALYMLPPAERQALRLRYEQGYSAQAIASLQDCSISAVRYRLRQGQRRLAAALARSYAASDAY